MMYIYIAAWFRANGISVNWHDIEEMEERLDRGWAIDNWLRTNGGIDAWFVWRGDIRTIGCQINPRFDVDDQARDLAMEQIREMDAYEELLEEKRWDDYSDYIAEGGWVAEIDLPEECFVDERMDDVYPA